MLFQRRRGLLFVYEKKHYDNYGGYDVKNHRIKLKNVIKKALNGKNIDYLGIMTKFNKIHYPVIDIDRRQDLNVIVNYLNDRHIPHVVLRSSPNHFWIIIDRGNKDFKKANEISLILNNCGLGDAKYQTFSMKRKMFIIRGFYQNILRLPNIISNIFLDRTYPMETTTGSWKTSYYRHQKIITSNITFSPNFSIFIDKLNDFYTTENRNGCKFISTLIRRRHETNH